MLSTSNSTKRDEVNAVLKKGDVRLGIAPIAWTNDDMPELGGDIPFEQCIDEMALAGYEGSEVGNKYPRDPEVLKAALEPRGLSIASAWFSAFLTTKPYEETEKEFIKHRDFLHAMGAKVIVVSEQGHSIQGQMETPLFQNKPVFTDDEWDRLVDGLNRLGQRAHEKGMQIVYHHHMGTGVADNGGNAPYGEHRPRTSFPPAGYRAHQLRRWRLLGADRTVRRPHQARSL